MINIDADKMLDIVNKNSDYTKVAEYILRKSDYAFSLEQAKKIAKYLIMEEKYTKEDLLQGKADDYIQKRAQAKLIELKSVRQSNEQIVEVPLKSFKHAISKDELKRLVALIASLAATIAILGIKNYEYKNEAMKQETSINLGLLANEVGSDSYNSERNIVIQSSLENIDPNTNEYISQSESLANNIIDVCIKDPTLFDITIFDTYYNIQFNRIDKLSETWGYLQSYMANDEAFSDLLNTKLNVPFLNYVLNMIVASGEIKTNNATYEKYINAINEYQKFQKYEKLSGEAKATLREMMDKYHNLGNHLYRENNKKIASLVEEQKDGFGGRS